MKGEERKGGEGEEEEERKGGGRLYAVHCGVFCFC